MRAKWSGMIQNYLLHRENLVTVFILIDGRIAPQESDLERINWLGENEIPFAIIFTKVEKLKSIELKTNVDTFMARLGDNYENLPNYFITSASGQVGRDDLLEYIPFVISQCID